MAYDEREEDKELDGAVGNLMEETDEDEEEGGGATLGGGEAEEAYE